MDNISFLAYQNRQIQEEKANYRRKKIGEASSHTEKQLKQIEFWFASVRTKKIYCFEDTLIESIFWRFFGLFRKSSVCFGWFDTSPKHRKKSQKKFGFVKQTKKRT